MKMKKIILFFSCCFLLLNCEHKDLVADIEPEEPFVTSIGKGSLHRETNIAKSNLVIKEATIWKELMNKMDTVNEETKYFTETNIDFSQYQVIAAIDKVQGSVHYLNIIDVAENQTNIVVTVEITVSFLSSIYQPYHIIKIPKTDKEIVFKEITK